MDYSRLDPAAFFRGEGWIFDKNVLRAGAQNKYRIVYDHMREEHASDYDLDRSIPLR